MTRRAPSRQGNGAPGAVKGDLTPKQQRFVDEYLVDLNATQAAIRAGYAKRSAEVTGSRMLRNAKVAAAVATGQHELAKRVGVTQEEIVAELKRIAFSDMRSFVEWGPDGVTLRPYTHLSDDAAACIAEIAETVTQHGGSKRFKLHDKVAALTQLGRHLGMFEDRVDLTSQGRPMLILDRYRP